MDEVGGLYFAQARRYDARSGRFVSEDKVRGFVEMPYTMNHYVYCWGNPIVFYDLNGWFALAALIGAGVGAVGGVVTGLTGNAAVAGAATAATSTLLEGMWEIWDGTREFNMETVVGLGFEVGLNGLAGAVMGKIGDKAGKLLAKGVGITGRNSLTSLYKQADTKIHTGTWKFSSLKVNTWESCIISESTTAMPGVFVSQFENALSDNVLKPVADAGVYVVTDIGETVIEEIFDEDIS